METRAITSIWLTRGNQRRAIALSLHGIMTGTELWQAARRHAPCITLRDTRAILRQFEARGLVRCLNAAAPCGRLFLATNRGSEVFGDQIDDRREETLLADMGLNPGLLSFILRGQVRLAVFTALAVEPVGKTPPQSASEVKRWLRESCPLTLNQAIRALQELEAAGLLHSNPSTGRQHRYALATKGVQLAKYLRWRRTNTGGNGG